jgi:hypothetical protein
MEVRMKYPMTLALTLCPSLALAQPVLPKFDPAHFEPGAAVTNPWFPLGPGYVREYLGTAPGDDGRPVEEQDLLVFVGSGPELGGVPTVMVLDNAWQNGRHVEEARDYYAQDRDGNVWYMGEDVTNFTYDAEGNLTGTDHHGSWRVGENGARPGFAMPADPQPGFIYEQEHSPQDEALDVGEIMGLKGKVSGPTGAYEDVLMVFETSQIETDLREVKYYARGLGMIRVEEEVDEARANPGASADLVRYLD